MEHISQEALAKAKDMAKYFMLNFMPHEKTYSQTFTQNEIVYFLEQHISSKGINYFLSMRHERDNLAIMQYRYFKEEDGVMCIGHGCEKQILESMEDLLIRMTSIVGPLLDLVEVRTKDAEEEYKNTYLGGSPGGWNGDIGYDNQKRFTLTIRKKKDDVQNWNVWLVTMVNRDPFKGPFPPALVRGNVGQIGYDIYDVIKEEMVRV